MRADELKAGDHFKLATDPRVLRLLAFDKGLYAIAGNDLVGLHPDSWVELVELVEPEAATSMPFKLGKLTGDVSIDAGRLLVSFDGYGSHADAPLVIFPDADSVPRALAYTEIHGIDPTHRLNFASARK